MKVLRFLLLFSAALYSFAADEKKEEKLPPLPTDVHLTNGAVLHHVVVVRWQKDTVVLKHAGGVDPIRYANMVPEDRAAFEANRAAGLTGEEAKNAVIRQKAEANQAADDASAAKRKRIQDAIARKTIVVGMTREEAIESWGKPDHINSSGGEYGSHEQWVYGNQYVYFEDGFVTSWQN